MEILRKTVETKRLGAIEIEVNAIVDANGMILSTVSHDSLQSLVTEHKLTYEYKVIVCEMSHTLIECKMSMPDNSYTVIGIGESTERSLDTGISQMYPSYMAYKRAFDSAALDIFGFPPRYYGDSSGVVGDTVNVTETPAAFKAENKKEKAEKKTAAKPQKEKKEAIKETEPSASVVEETTAESSVKGKEEPAVNTEEKTAPEKDVASAVTETVTDSKPDGVQKPVEEAIEENVEEPEPEPEAEPESEPEPEAVSEVELLAKEEITFAKKIAGKTFAEIAKTTNAKWLDWALTKYNPVQPDIIENLTKFRRYCELIGVKGDPNA